MALRDLIFLATAVVCLGADASGGTVTTAMQVRPNCTLEVHGIAFDSDKATLTPGSEPALRAVLALFDADADYFAEIRSSADAIGSRAHKRELSEARAVALKAWLVSHDVGEQRVTPRAAPGMKPYTPNATRVELRRTVCR